MDWLSDICSRINTRLLVTVVHCANAGLVSSRAGERRRKYHRRNMSIIVLRLHVNIRNTFAYLRTSVKLFK